MVPDPESVWYVLEVALIPAMVVVGTFFFALARRERAASNQSAAVFNLGYCAFFLVNAVNQLAYVADSVDAFWPEFNAVLARDYALALPELGIGDVGLSSQIVFMIVCFLWSFVLNVHAVEKYLRQSSKRPLSRAGVVAAVAATVAWLAWYQPWLSNPAFVQVPSPPTPFNYLLGFGVVFIVVVGLAMIFLFVAIYFDLARKTPGAVRRKGLVIGFGILFMYASLVAGNLLRGEGLLPGYWTLLGPVLLLAGIAILVYGFTRRI
ncbi:MAG: hypothetical protein Kow0069_20210 [Promethearchaeota archaeon]